MSSLITPDVPQPRAAVAELPRYSRASGLSQVRWRASSNESTVAPSPAILDAIASAGAQAHLYPSLLGDDLIGDISAGLGVAPQQVLVGGGSLALLQQTLAAYAGHGAEVVHAWRSYEAYPILIGVAGATGVPVQLDSSFTHDVDAILAAVTPSTRAVIVCNPNNPTGTELGPDDLDRLLAEMPSHVLVLLDEAYKEFANGDVDGIALVQRHRNVAVFRTFSKAYGLAGLRAGYMITTEEIADNVRAASPPFGLSIVAEAAARAAWADEAHTERIVRVVTEGREHLRTALAERGIATPASGSNFVWIPVGRHARALEQACVDHGVSVRAFDGEGVRVTVGERDAENAVIDAVDSILDRLREAPRSKAAAGRE